MATKVSDYKPTTYKGVWVNKTDDTKFLLRYYIEGGSKQRMKVWKANKVHGKKDREKNAFYEREALVGSQGDHGASSSESEAKMNATVDDYFERLFTYKKRLKYGDDETPSKTPSSEGWSREVLSGNRAYYHTHLEPIIGKLKITAIHPRHITAINEHTAPYAPRTRKKAFEILMPLFAMALEDGLIKTSPIQPSHKIKRSQKKEMKVIKGSAINKYKAVFGAIMKVYAGDPHHRALFLFGMDGRRKGETLQMKWSDIDLNTKSYTVRAEISKSGVDKRYTMSDELAAALSELADKGTKDDVFHVACVNRHMTRLIREESGVPEFTYHWMRNLVVSALAADGTDSAVLSAMLGHEDLNTVKRYLTMQNLEASATANDAARGLRS